MERFDLYDRNRMPTGATMVRGTPVPEGLCRLTVHAALFAPDGTMLIQKRTGNKRVWPGRWDVTCGGCVTAGETSSEAVCREVLEEVGIDMAPEDLTRVFTIDFGTGFDDYFVGSFSGDPKNLTLQEDEVADVRFAAVDEILAMIEDGSFINYRPSLILLLADFAAGGKGAFRGGRE